MAKIKPFEAVIYNRNKIGDFSKVVCPPYDVISPERQEYYHNINPYNFIHILLGKDIAGEDKYARSAAYFKDWLKDNIFCQDTKPAIYFYSQQYLIKGERKTRFGFIALLKLDDDKESSVFRHEHTHIEAKEDRLRLLRKVKANLSPIFAIFLDKKRIIKRIRERYVSLMEPFIEVIDDEATVHKIWRIDEPEALSFITSAISGEKIFIADGHHRYEVACAYRDELRKKAGSSAQGDKYNYILTYFTNTDTKGLSILPINRLLKLEYTLDWRDFKNKLNDFFHIQEIQDKKHFFFLMEKSGRTERVLGVYKDSKYLLLRLRNVKMLNVMMPDTSDAHRALDVAVLNEIVFKRILNIDFKDKKNISFSPDMDELIRRVDSDPHYLAFFLNPVKVQDIISVALNNERMPPKTTYFYPKVLSGLVINKLE